MRSKLETLQHFGKYMAISVLDSSLSGQHGLQLMTNYTRITSMDKQNVSRRGANRGGKAEVVSVSMSR
jgi:hypothetical protein